MKPKGKVNRRLLCCICCGVVAAISMSVYLSNVSAEALESRASAIEEYGGETVEVCVATRDISEGETVTQDDVELMTWLVDLLPQDAATSLEDVVGQTALQDIYSNEPITSSKVGDLSTAISVPDGLCAVSVPSEDVQAVGGAIKAGSTVDVYAVGSSVQLIGEDILVLETSISDSSDDSSDAVFGDASSRGSVSWVTLAVTPESVAELITASESGNLYFALPGEDIQEDSSSGESEEESLESEADSGEGGGEL